MRLTERWRPVLLVAVFVAVGCAFVVLFRSNLSPQTMLSYLPPGEGPVLYLDVELLRQTGILEQLAGKRGGEEADYRKFVEATGFDYRRDLDALMVQWRRGTALFVVKGRFDQQRLETYVRSSGGICAHSYCSLAGSVPERRISFQPLTRGTLALAAGTDPMGAATIHEYASQPAFIPPTGPIWISLPASSFHTQPDLPAALNVFFDALQGAQHAVLNFTVHADGFELTLNAPCESIATAKLIADRLAGATADLKDLIARSGRAPEASSPAAVLSVGTFRSEQQVVLGRWPVTKQFLLGLAK